MNFLSDPSSLRTDLVAVCFPLLLICAYKLGTSVGDGTSRRLVDPREEQRRTRRKKQDGVFDLDDGQEILRPATRASWMSRYGGSASSGTVLIKEGQQVRGRIRSTVDENLRINGRIAWRKPKNDGALYGIAFDQISRLPDDPA